MKKICFVTTIPITMKIFILDTAKYLHDHGSYDITFISNEDEEFRNLLPEYINFISVPMKRGISIYGIQSVFRMFQVFRSSKFDLVQYSTPQASLFASIAAKFAGIPVRLYCQWGIVYVGFTGWKRQIFKGIEKMVCSLSTWVEPDSFGNRTFSIEEGLYPKDKVSVTWNGSARGVNLTKFDIRHKDIWRDEIRKQYQIGHDTFVLGFVGNMSRDKGVNELFGAYQSFLMEFPDSVLFMIGNPDKCSTLDESLYKWSLIEERIIYCGTVDEVEKFLSAMDVFVLPSYREGFGSVIIEAGAMGVPVIATDIPGPREAVVDKETGILIEKANTKALLESLRTYRLDENNRLESGQNGYQFVRNRFDSVKLMAYILQDRDNLLNRFLKRDLQEI